MKILLIVCGTLCVALALVGMFIPILPTTPFLLLAAVCYARSSERFYQAGRGIPLREKTLMLSMLWLTMGISILFVVSAWWIRLILVGIAVGVSIHLIKIKTYYRELNPDL
jgi:uncharacterized membrane protein YbaN (DUF454 family)